MAIVDWGPFVQTALGATTVIVVNEIAHMHRVSETLIDARRVLYGRLVRHLYKLQHTMADERSSDPDRTLEHALILEMDEIQAELDILASDPIREAVVNLQRAMSQHYDPSAPHHQHQDAVLLGLGEEAANIIELARHEIQGEPKRHFRNWRPKSR